MAPALLRKPAREGPSQQAVVLVGVTSVDPVFELVRMSKMSQSAPHHKTIYFDEDEDGEVRLVNEVVERQKTLLEDAVQRELYEQQCHALDLLLADCRSKKKKSLKKMSKGRRLDLVCEFSEIERRRGAASKNHWRRNRASENDEYEEMKEEVMQMIKCKMAKQRYKNVCKTANALKVVAFQNGGFQSDTILRKMLHYK